MAKKWLSQNSNRVWTFDWWFFHNANLSGILQESQMLHCVYFLFLFFFCIGNKYILSKRLWVQKYLPISFVTQPPSFPTWILTELSVCLILFLEIVYAFIDTFIYINMHYIFRKWSISHSICCYVLWFFSPNICLQEIPTLSYTDASF